MTITVTAHPETTPPSCTIDVSVTAGHVMSAVAVYRNDQNGRTLLRTQPSAGFDSRTVTDYECPYEENVTYDWTATSSDPAAASTLFSEAWVSTASWTTTSGTWNVSGGRVRNTSFAAGLQRTFTASKYRYSFGYWAVASGYGTIGIYDGSVGGTGIWLKLTGGVLSFGNSLSNLVATTVDATQPFVIDVNATTVTLSGTGGSATFSSNRMADRIVLTGVTAGANAFQLGTVSVKSYAASTDTAQTSSPVSLEPDEAWLIHPGSPNLSFPLAQASGEVAGIRSIEPIVNRSNTTVHKVLGSATPIPTTTGPRSDDETVVSIGTMTTSESSSLRALLADDVPLLIQFPPSWDLDFNSGFYQPGDVTTSRIVDLPVPYRVFTLPLQKVQSPVVDIENTGWSYASVAVEFATYADLLTSFGTYADLASNTRL